MQTSYLRSSGIALMVGILLLSGCKRSEREVPEGTVLGNVQVALPSGAPAQLGDIKLLSGVFDETNASGDGAARIGLVPSVVSAVTAVSKNDEPLLYSIAITPSEGQEVRLDARSTAEALVFLNPCLVQTDTGFAADVMSIIKAAPQIDTLTALIESRLSQSTGYLLADDSAMGVAVLAAVGAIRATIESSTESPCEGPAGKTAVGSSGVEGGVKLSSGAEGLEFYLPAGENPFCGVGIRAEQIGAGQYKLWIKNDRRRYVYAFLRRGYSDDFLDSTLIFSSSAISVIPPHWTKPESSSIVLDAASYPETWLLTYGPGAKGTDEWEMDPHKERICLPSAATVLTDVVGPVISVVTGIPGVMSKGSQAAEPLVQLAINTIGLKLIDKTTNEDALGIVLDVAKFTFERLVQHPQDLVDFAAEVGVPLTTAKASGILGKVPYLGFALQCLDAFNLGWSIGTWGATYKSVNYGITYTGGSGSFPSRVVGTIPVGDLPDGAAALPSGAYVYIANAYSDDMSVIRTSDNTVVDIVQVGDWPLGIAVLPNGTYAYVANYGADSVAVVRTSDNTVTATIPVGSGPEGVCVLPNGSHVYVSNVFGGSVSVIRASSNTVVATIPVGNGPEGMAVLPNGSYVYLANIEDNSVSVIRTSDNTVVQTIAVGARPGTAAVLPNGSYVYVANNADNSVSVIRTSDNAVVDVVQVGSGPAEIAVLPNGDYLYVSGADDNSVTVVRTSDNAAVATIPVGAGPCAITVLPSGNYLYVTNSLDDNVSVIGY